MKFVETWRSPGVPLSLQVEAGFEHHDTTKCLFIFLIPNQPDFIKKNGFHT